MNNSIYIKLYCRLFRTEFHQIGPLTFALKCRAILIYLLLVCIGCGIAFLSSSPAIQTFGLGLIFPGTGFAPFIAGDASQVMLYAFFALISIAAFGVSIFLWFVTGNIIAAPLVYLLAAFSSASLHFSIFHVVAPMAWIDTKSLAVTLAISIGLSIAAVCLLQFYRFRQKNTLAHFSQTSGELRTQVDFDQDKAQQPNELSFEDLSRIRFLLDRALQPIASYKGFEWIDQFQSAAVRYQLQFAGFALALVQFNHLPAFRGYLTEAQARLIEKQRNPKVWSYWALENFWGNLRINSNPFDRDNIMFTGFCATQIALFQAASRDMRFSERNSFSLQAKKGKNHTADFKSLIQNLVSQHKHSALGLIACEPNWIFPICNSIGFVALKHHDMEFKTEHWKTAVPRMRHNLESEFRSKNGEFVTCRSSLTGFAMPSIGGNLTKVLPSFFLNATIPDIAKRNWLLVRPQMLNDLGGRCVLNTRSFWPVDVGNYRFTRIAGFAGAAACATELGDHVMRGILLAALDKQYPAKTQNGITHRPNASIWAHAMEIIARCSRKDSLRDLVSGNNNSSGLYIEMCSYPDVLVAKAIAQNGCLEAVLYPENDPTTQSIDIGGLLPNENYLYISSNEQIIRSDADGKAKIDVNLCGRTTLFVHRVKESM